MGRRQGRRVVQHRLTHGYPSADTSPAADHREHHESDQRRCRGKHAHDQRDHGQPLDIGFAADGPVEQHAGDEDRHGGEREHHRQRGDDTEAAPEPAADHEPGENRQHDEPPPTGAPVRRPLRR
jgi:hypothetical protein